MNNLNTTIIYAIKTRYNNFFKQGLRQNQKKTEKYKIIIIKIKERIKKKIEMILI